MLHVMYGQRPESASVAILVKETALDAEKVKQAYITEIGANPEGFIAYSLWYNDQNKAPADLAKDYLETVLTSVKSLGIKEILITDSIYFKFLTGQQKPASTFIGYPVKSKLKNFEGEFTVFYAPNYQATKYNPNIKQELELAMTHFKKHLTGSYVEPGKDIINTAQYPRTLNEIKSKLEWLLSKPELTVDIETKGLKFWNCGIATISFAWDKHNFISFPVDRGFFEAKVNDCWLTSFGQHVKCYLREFFEAYEGKLIAHNTNFDFKILVYELWMKDLQDYKGMINGIQILTKNFDDTKLILYLATNNAVENKLGLKDASKEFMGSYSQDDIKDTEKIPLDTLLEYNGKDCLATWFTYEKYYPLMVADQQEELYKTLFKPSVITLLQTELCGIPILPQKVAKARKVLETERDIHVNIIQSSKLVEEFQLQVKYEKAAEFTAAAKKKVFDIDDPRVARLEFNPGSNQQVAKLLYDYFGLPVLDLTDSKEPAVGQKTLKKLLHHTTKQEYLDIINALIDLSQVDKILSSFIPAFENNSVQLPDGSWRLYGNFNLGGTVSGRLSSSDPNLQNIPSNSHWAKLIKECFGCITGWLFGGADFNSLEDMVSALTTRDPNKMKVYLDGYDGHCLRAFSYFGDQMPDIVDTVDSINSIETKYKDLRQKSKGPTFALTYQGTYHTLMTNLGLDEATARKIEAGYHALYKVADEWVEKKLQQACKDGYVTGAFGLKLRTPLLKMNGPGKLHYKAAAEGRTAGNMLGQSYGMLNSRAANEFRERVWASKYRHDILLCGQIHDACYIFWRNTVAITKWVNDNLIDCMQWCGLVELQHPKVKLGAGLDIFYPDWAHATTLKNRMSQRAILNLCKRPKDPA